MLGEGWISLEELSISKWEAKSSGSEDGGEGRSLSIQRVVECAKDLALTYGQGETFPCLLELTYKLLLFFVSDCQEQKALFRDISCWF